MRNELGKWLMDIAKYMTTAVLLSSLFTGVNEWKWYLYVLLVLAIITTLVVGLLLTKKKGD